MSPLFRGTLDVSVKLKVVISPLTTDIVVTEKLSIGHSYYIWITTLKPRSISLISSLSKVTTSTGSVAPSLLGFSMPVILIVVVYSSSIYYFDWMTTVFDSRIGALQKNLAWSSVQVPPLRRMSLEIVT